MPRKRRIGSEGRRNVWTWDDRGRSAVTRESVLRDLEALHDDPRMLSALVAGLVRI
jgi:hypothetical protein